MLSYSSLRCKVFIGLGLAIVAQQPAAVLVPAPALVPAVASGSAAADSLLLVVLVSNSAIAPSASSIPALVPRAEACPPLSCHLQANWVTRPDERDMEVGAFAGFWRRRIR